MQPFRTYSLHVLDKAARTALQVAAGLLVAGRGAIDWRAVLLATALAVAVSVLQSVVDFPAIPGGLLGDITGRALRTFAQTAVGATGASVLITDVAWSTVLTAAALAAAASVVTSGIGTSVGVKGTPDLVSPVKYAGYTDPSRHLRPSEPRYIPTALAASAVALCAFVGITTVGVISAHHAPVRVLAAPAPLPPAPPVSLPPPDKSPQYFEALNRAQIPTAASDHETLLDIANSVCNARTRTSDLQQANRIVAAHPGKWTQQQATTIVDVAIDSYCT
jgi:hypothetical protein